MTEQTSISIEDFCACLAQSGPVSAKINAARLLNVDSITEEDQNRLVHALLDFAGTKHGPLLIMELPVQLQALLAFAGVVMPGQDRLAYIKASPEQVVNRLIRHDDRKLRENYDFSKFKKKHWAELLTRGKLSAIPKECEPFLANKNGNGFSNDELIELAKHCPLVVSWINTEVIAGLEPRKAVELLVCTPETKVWDIFDLGLLNGRLWAELVCNCPREIAGKYLAKLRTAKDLDTVCVDAILRTNPKYYPYVPLDLASPGLIVDLLKSGKVDELWNKYSFSLLTDDDWFNLLTESSHPVPGAGMVFLANESGKLDINRLNTLLAKRNELVDYMNPHDVDPKQAARILINRPSTNLWCRYDFKRFSDKQILAIVGGAADRHSWPELIYAKFSIGEHSFTDTEILDTAEKRIANVIELLSVERIHKAGVKFFSKICQMASKSEPAVATVVKKLANDSKPWLELEREFQVALMAAVPSCRKYILWQDFELKYLAKMCNADGVFSEELPIGRKIKLFFWRSKYVAAIILIVMSWVTCDAIAEKMQQEKLREISNRQAVLISQINALCENGNFPALDKLWNDTSNGEDAEILGDSRVASASSRLEQWKSDRNSIAQKLSSLETIAKKNWCEEDLKEAAVCFTVLNNSVYAWLPDERYKINEYYKRFDARRKEIAHVKRNKMLSERIESIKWRSLWTNEMSAVLGNLSELDEILRDTDVSRENVAMCKKARTDMYAHFASLFTNKLNKASEVINVADSISVIDIQTAEIRNLQNTVNLSDQMNAECESFLQKAKFRKEELTDKENKQHIALIHEKVVDLLERIKRSEENDYSRVLDSFKYIPYLPSFEEYHKEYSAEFQSLTMEVQIRNKGISCADQLVTSVSQYINEISKKRIDGKDITKGNVLVEECDKWHKEYLPVISWKTVAVKTAKEQVLKALSDYDERAVLIAKANEAQDYSTLYTTIQSLMEKYSDSFECKRIDMSRIFDESQINTAITHPRWSTNRNMFEFVGSIKINPVLPELVVPQLNKTVNNQANIYYVREYYDSETGECILTVKKIFERNSEGGFRKIRGIDYEKCQGIGLFVCNDPSYVDWDSWHAGARHPAFPHWMASSKPGKWLIEPGYKKASLFGDDFSEVKWCPQKTFGKWYCTGEREGTWCRLDKCKECGGSGRMWYRYDRGEQTCSSCHGQGKDFYLVNDKKLTNSIIQYLLEDE